MSSSAARREKLFNIYSTNLKLFLSKNNLSLSFDTAEGKQEITEDIYICPLCLHGFYRIALNQSFPNPLTIEHVPPKNSGGKPIILLCKKCNSEKGHQVDHVIPKMLSAEPFLNNQPGSSIQGKMSPFAKSNLPLNLVKSADNKLIFNIKAPLNAFILDKFNSLLSDGDKHEVKFSLHIPDKHKYAQAILRAGYLLAFNFFGNALLYEPNIQTIRKHILYPKENPLPHSAISVNDDITPFYEGIHLVTNPPEFRSYVVVFKTVTAQTKKYNMVFLPGPGKLGWSCYENLKNYTRSTELTLVELTSDDILKSISSVNWYVDLFITGAPAGTPL